MINYKRQQDSLIENLGYYISEAILYGRLIKYKKIDEILQSFMPQLPREVNIFLELNSILFKLYNFENISNPIGILACMVNIPLHYRHYFNRLNIKSNIFLIYSSNDSINNYRYIAGYNSKERLIKESNKPIHDIIIRNIELLGTLTPYLPGIYLKKGTVEPAVIAYDLISKFSKNGTIPTTNIYISSSDYAYQLPIYAYNTILLYKKSMLGDNKAEDISIGATRYNSLNTYISTNNKQIYTKPIPQEWISPFLVLNGLPCRDIKMILSYKRSLQILEKITNEYNIITPETMYTSIIESYKAKEIHLEELYARYYAIDLNHQLNLYRQLPESLESNFLIDIYDQQALYDIANMYFTGTNIIEFQKL